LFIDYLLFYRYFIQKIIIPVISIHVTHTYRKDTDLLFLTQELLFLPHDLLLLTQELLFLTHDLLLLTHDLLLLTEELLFLPHDLLLLPAQFLFLKKGRN
ncbi:MAG: hypothetical protein L0Y73_05670, partial [Candidatus Aminicenantes bacterium]|nr:hypothetical protein [Candidatus Aminicenantes bacterium]